MISEKRYFGNTHYEFGEMVPLETCPILAQNQDGKESLLGQGYRFYSRINEDVEVHIKSCCEQTLSKSELSSDDINMVVIASNTYSYDRTLEGRIQLALQNCGFNRQVVVGVNYGLCANFSTALRVACALLDGVLVKTILIVVIDSFPEDFNRIGPNNMHIVSDCVSSCVVSSNPLQFEVLSIAQAGFYDHTVMRNVEPLGPIKKLQDTAGALKHVKSLMQQQGGLETNKMPMVIAENHNIEVMTFASKLLNVAIEKFKFVGKAEHGHAAASDLLVSLTSCETKKQLKGETEFMLFSISPTIAALIALKYVGSDE